MSALRSELQLCVRYMVRRSGGTGDVEEFCDAVQQRVARNQRFLTRGEVFYFHLRPLVAVKKRDPRPDVFGTLKLFSHLVACERVIDAITAVAQFLNLLEGIAAALFLRDDNVDVDLVLIFDCAFKFFARFGAITNQFSQYDVTHRETERRHRNGAVAQLADQIVVAAATGNRSQFSGAIENFENNAGVISKPADDLHVDIDKASKSPGAKSIDQSIQF